MKMFRNLDDHHFFFQFNNNRRNGVDELRVDKMEVDEMGRMP